MSDKRIKSRTRTGRRTDECIHRQTDRQTEQCLATHRDRPDMSLHLKVVHNL